MPPCTYDGRRGENSPVVYARPVKRELLEWFRANGRDLPWRHTRDPYAILVSEVMLQQTWVTSIDLSR
jgi:A/G-specific adenine glycosylase